MIIQYKQASSRLELQQILQLQERNLYENLSVDERETQGFVTVRHDLPLLEEMNATCGHIVAMDGDCLAGYALCMHPRFSGAIPVLMPMFEQIDGLLPKEYPYMVMGQVCVDKAYRSMGIFRGLYQTMQQLLGGAYHLIITEVDALNTRSVRAHRAVGFQELCRYSSGGQDWLLVKLPTS